jgi:hypothetical protein
MDSNVTGSIVTIATGIIGVAILAVLVSKNANTSGVIASAGNAFSSALGVAEGPVTGGGMGNIGGYTGGGASSISNY